MLGCLSRNDALTLSLVTGPTVPILLISGSSLVLMKLLHLHGVIDPQFITTNMIVWMTTVHRDPTTCSTLVIDANVKVSNGTSVQLTIGPE
jgi:hypothetical protein